MKLPQLDAQTYLACLFLILGGGYLLQELGLINFSWLLGHTWPLFIIGFGFLQLAQNPTNRTSSLIIIAIGTLLTLSTLGQEVNFWALIWPVILILIGVSFLRRPRPAISDADHHTASTVMAEDKQQITSQQFKQGDHFVLMGSSKLDLTKTAFSNKEAIFQINVIMGELKLIVPPNTRIINKASLIMGEFKDRSTVTDKPAQTLTITGSVLMGSVEASN